MKNLSRRNFIKRTGLATAGTMAVPMFLKAFENRPFLANTTQKKLIIIQFSGGNDGLNAIVPYTNDIYYRNRPSIAVKPSEVLKATDELGFNPNLKVLRNLYDEGSLSIINNIGYPDPDRSHFRSMDIWHSASGANQFLSSGWLGRYLDQDHRGIAHKAIEIDDTLSMALKGQQKSGFAMSNPYQLHKTTNNKTIRTVRQHHHDHEHEESVAYLYKTLSNTVSSADYLFEKSKVYRSTETYPKGKLGKEFKQVAELIISGSDTQIYYLTIGGFDTHSNQVNQQNKLFRDYAAAIAALVNDLKKNNQWKNSLVMTFSEFGRRVAENGSRGTDHGKANNLYLMGGSIKKAGFYNDGPDLDNLDNGDLSFEIDFRRVYANILNDWLQTDSQTILRQQFKGLGIV
jgi:uncharacterized protein (DUF1501 family)